MNISIGARTDVGGRSNNEDCLAVLDKDRVQMRADAVLVIADGMGGRANGEEASAIAVKVVRETLMDLLDPANDHTLPPAEDILSAAIRRANSNVYQLSQDNPELPGMGTTCVAALVSEGVLTLAHVGDSRAYLVRDNTLIALTSDHTYVAEQVRAGNMSQAAAKTSRFKNVITKAIGIAPTVEPDFETVALRDTDTVVLCTDGLTNTLDETTILTVIRQSETAQSAASGLLFAAKAAGVRDNVTIITVRVTSDVQSSRFRLIESLEGSQQIDIPEPELEELPAGSIDINEGGRTRPAQTVQAPTVGKHLVLAVLISALLGALVAAGSFLELGILGVLPAGLFGQREANTYSSAHPDYLALQYEPARQIYYKPLRSNFLLVADASVFVALGSSGEVVRLNLLGQDKGVAPISLTSTAAPSLYAIDRAGDIYTEDVVAGSIEQISSSGLVKREVVTGLDHPGAFAVSPSGDIYVINDGSLFLSKATIRRK